MKKILKRMAITLAVFFVFGALSMQIDGSDQKVNQKINGKTMVVYNEPISTFNLGK